MEIRDVYLASSAGPKVASFYGEVLELPVVTTPSGVSVHAGSTRIHFLQGDGEPQPQHLAFNIPPNTFAAAKAWLRERAGLLTNDGEDEFECAPTWNARSLYFSGPDESILEFIARRRLLDSHDADFTWHDISCVSEVGLAVDDVASVQLYLQQQGIVPFGDGSDSFRPVGDDHGLVILVESGRTWFPTSTQSHITDTAIRALVGSEERLLRFNETAG